MFQMLCVGNWVQNVCLVRLGRCYSLKKKRWGRCFRKWVKSFTSRIGEDLTAFEWDPLPYISKDVTFFDCLINEKLSVIQTGKF